MTLELQYLSKMCQPSQNAGLGQKINTLITDIKAGSLYTGDQLTSAEVNFLNQMCKGAQDLQLGTVVDDVFRKSATGTTITPITAQQANNLNQICITCRDVGFLQDGTEVKGFGSLIRWVGEQSIDTGNSILSFTIPNQVGTTTINETTGEIDLFVRGATKTGIIATFTTSRDATVKVGNTTQVSGVTPNDFTSVVEYIVTSESGVSRIYEVNLTSVFTLHTNYTNATGNITDAEGEVVADGEDIYEEEILTVTSQPSTNFNQIFVNDVQVTHTSGQFITTVTVGLADLTVNVEGKKQQYSVDTTGSANVSYTYASAPQYFSQWSGTITADTGYTLPNTIQVYNGGVTLDTSSFTYDKTLLTNNIVISPGVINGTIKIVGIAVVSEYTITPTLTNCTGDSTNPTTIQPGGSETLMFTANSGYVLPSTVSVTGATVDSWDNSTGTLVISSATGNVTFSISALQELPFVFNGSRVTQYTGSSTSIDIPSGYDTITVGSTTKYVAGSGTTVTAIAASIVAAVADPSIFTSLTIPSTINTIMSNAFGLCTNLTRVIINATGSIGISNGVFGSNDTTNPGKLKLNGTGATLYSLNGGTRTGINGTYTTPTAYNLYTYLTGVSEDVFPMMVPASGTTITGVTAIGGLTLPDTITVTGASHTWDKTTGTIVLTNVTGDVSITIVAT